MKISRLLFIGLFLIGCNHDEPKVDATTYINEVVDLMEAHALNKKSIDWTAFRSDVVAKANSTGDIKSTVEYTLQKLGDAGAYVIRNGDYIFGVIPNPCEGTSAGTLEDEEVGYIKVAANSGTDNTAAVNLQAEIRGQDSEKIKGWIVDLRGTSGGNMWPMIGGLGPILGEGISGYFVDGDLTETSWKYENGEVTVGSQTAITVASPYNLINSNPKIAVLTGGITASAGEGAAIAFIGKANTRSFGSGTCGLSTASAGYNISDGSVILLTIAVMADRNKQQYGGSITPEVLVDGDQAIIDKAVEWIKEP